MSKMRLLEATITRLRSKALDRLTRVEIMLENPTAVGDHMNYVDEIEENIREVMICENAINALQMYFVPQQQAPAPAPAPPPQQMPPPAPAPEPAPEPAPKATRKRTPKKK